MKSRLAVYEPESPVETGTSPKVRYLAIVRDNSSIVKDYMTRL